MDPQTIGIYIGLAMLALLHFVRSPNASFTDLSLRLSTLEAAHYKLASEHAGTSTSMDRLTKSVDKLADKVDALREKIQTSGNAHA